ncbi:hypothetical protein IPC392_06430 [Pseudomonas aeruginosa]|nr:hypothetical protein IPC392_06430 [Pseudomonas aeruginosa]
MRPQRRSSTRNWGYEAAGVAKGAGGAGGAGAGVGVGVRAGGMRRPAGSRAAHGARRSAGGGPVPGAGGRGASLGHGGAAERRRYPDQGPCVARRTLAADRLRGATAGGQQGLSGLGVDYVLFL